MLRTLAETSDLIRSGAPLHIAGTESLLRKLPKGNWIGGSTEYFMTENGGKVSGELLFVTSFQNVEYTITSYDEETLPRVAADAYDNGFSIVIIPFESPVHKAYAHNAAGYQGMFLKNIVGWISGLNLNAPEQTPIAVNGQTGEVLTGQAAVLHLRVPDGKMVNVGMVNIFEQDDKTPVIEFEEEGFVVKRCLVDGKTTALADYIHQNGIDTKLPLVGNYSGVGVNISVKTVEDGSVSFYAPVFKGIRYRIAKPVGDYTGEFGERLVAFKNTEAMFSCNCILNFLYGGLEGKEIDTFFGPITFGEIAYQLVNQTLVYVTITG